MLRMFSYPRRPLCGHFTCYLTRTYHLLTTKAIGKVVRVRETADKTTTETAYYLLSRVLSPERFNQVARQHWGIENSLHWRLDVVMNEDQDRTRIGHGPHNLAVLRHMAINAMQKEGSKGSLRGKFKRAGWDDDYLFRLLELF
ncbi:MAG: ISAs1 family transposase [Acidobacteriaceae bacterium]